MYDGDKWMHALVGKTVVGIDVSEREEALRFRCDDGTTLVWETAGDCCSESWWADGFTLNALRGGTVRDVTPLDLPEPDDKRTRQEYDEAYGVHVTTNQGVSKLVFRNSSNGYYGGWANLREDGDRFTWREITENDWQA